MPQFSQDTINSYLANNNYRGIVDYVSKFKFNDPKVQEEVDGYLSVIKDNADMAEAILDDQTNDDDRNKIQFQMNVLNKVDSAGDTDYGDIYNDLINKYGKPESTWNTTPQYTNVEEITYVFHNKNHFDNFMNKLSSYPIEGKESQNEKGYKTFTINRESLRNPSKAKHLFETLNQVKAEDKKDFLGSVKQTAANLGLFGLNIKGEDVAWHAESYGHDNKNNRIQLYSWSPTIQDNVFNFTNAVARFRMERATEANLLSLFNETAETFNKALDARYSKVADTELKTSPVLTRRHAEIFDKKQRGLINQTEYDAELKDANKEVLRRIRDNQFATSEYPLFYAIDEDTNKLINIKGEDRQKAIAMLHALIDDKNDKISITGGVAGSQQGTVISITEYDKEDGKIKSPKEHQYFIPNFLKEELVKYANYDPNLKTTMDMFKHAAFKSKYSVNGGYYDSFQSDGSAKFHTSVNDPGKFKSKEEVYNDILRFNTQELYKKGMVADLGQPKDTYTESEAKRIQDYAKIQARVMQNLDPSFKFDANDPKQANYIKNANDIYNQILYFYRLK
ncbi:MAG: hypothetical protein MJ209_00185 [archaeon]|nr:hypothetical protein [archaeon]